MAQNAWKYKFALEALDSELRNMIKHGNYDTHYQEGLSRARELLNEALDQEGVEIWTD